MFSEVSKSNVNQIHNDSLSFKNFSFKKKRLALGCTTLMYACQQGDIGVILKHMRAKRKVIHRCDNRNKNVLHYCAAQRRPNSEDIVAAASLAIKAPELLDSADEDGFTPLHLSVIQGNMPMVNLLLANNADVNAIDHEGHSVVHWATVCGEVEILRTIISAGANITIADINGGSPLHYAAQMCGTPYDVKTTLTESSKLAIDILEILLNHPQCNVNIQDKDGRQPLLWAASAGSPKAVVAIIKAGGRVESADKDGLTALHCAASRGHTECIDTLISLCGALVDLIDSNGCTALHYAVTLGHADATVRLLELDADPNRQDRKGRSPAHCGCAKGQLETVKILKKYGANLWLRNAKGDLPIHEATVSGRRELIEWLLLQRTQQVNTTSNDGRSMLHIAANHNYTDICKTLLDYGANINAIYKNSKGTLITPLDSALQKGHRSTAKFLQSQGGLPATRLYMNAKYSSPFKNSRDLLNVVRPIGNDKSCEDLDLTNSKEIVVLLKEICGDECKCTSNLNHKIYRCICKQNKQKQYNGDNFSKYRRRSRSSSCDDSKSRSNVLSDLCRSKSNIEIRYKLLHDKDDNTNQSEDSDSCDNCCYHKYTKHHILCKGKKKKSYKRINNFYNNKKQISTKESKSKTELNNGPKPEVNMKLQSVVDKEDPNNVSSSEELFQKNVNDINGIDKIELEKITITQKDDNPTDMQILTEDNFQQIENNLLEEKSNPTSELITENINVQEQNTSNIELLEDKTDYNEEVCTINDSDNRNENMTKDNIIHSNENIIQFTNEEVAIPDTTKFDYNEDKNHNSNDLPVAAIDKKNSVNQIDKEDNDSDVDKQTICEMPISVEEKLKLSDIPLNISDSKDIENNMQLNSTQHKDNSNSFNEENQTKGTNVGNQFENKANVNVSYSDVNESYTVLPSDSSDNENCKEIDIIERKSSFQIITSDNDFNKVENYLGSDRSNATSPPVFTVLDKNGKLYPNYDDSDLHNPNENNSKDMQRSLSNKNDFYNSVELFRQKSASDSLQNDCGRNSRNENSNNMFTDIELNRDRQKLILNDEESAFELSPCTKSSKIPLPRQVSKRQNESERLYRPGSTFNSKTDSNFKQKPGDRYACNMETVTKSIQSNIRRYYMERKIFQHLLELKSMQIRSKKCNESILVKRAVNGYHKSCATIGTETGIRLQRYKSTEYTFKKFELFLYETLKKLQRPGTNNFRNIEEVYTEAERCLSPDYKSATSALQCTSKTHRCFHAAHAYTGIPCAAYIPMMNHHTIPKFGFGPYKNNKIRKVCLPKILTTNSECEGKLGLELSQGKNKHYITLPSDKLDANKKYYVTLSISND